MNCVIKSHSRPPDRSIIGGVPVGGVVACESSANVKLVIDSAARLIRARAAFCVLIVSELMYKIEYG